MTKSPLSPKPRKFPLKNNVICQWALKIQRPLQYLECLNHMYVGDLVQETNRVRKIWTLF